MSLLTVVLTLIAVGVGLWLVNQYVPMAKSMKTILNVVVVVVVVLWLLSGFGILGRVDGLRLPRAR